MNHLPLILSTLAFLAGVMHAVASLKRGTWGASRWHSLPIFIGFAFQMVFLYQRGELHQRCPLTNLFEILIFIGWGIVLLYFLVGPTFRLSLLGVFTAPMIALLQTLALIVSVVLPWDHDVGPPKVKATALGELHAAVSLIAYAAFAMACVTGVMYLLQARLLKKHRIHGLFYQLPPIHDLAKAIQRLTLWGSVLLTVGIACSPHPAGRWTHAFASWGVWGFYGLVNVVMWRHSLSARRTAWLAVLGFLVPMVSLWLLSKA